MLLKRRGLIVMVITLKKKRDKQFPELKSILYCDICEKYPDDESDYDGHIESLK